MKDNKHDETLEFMTHFAAYKVTVPLVFALLLLIQMMQT